MPYITFRILLKLDLQFSDIQQFQALLISGFPVVQGAGVLDAYWLVCHFLIEDGSASMLNFMSRHCNSTQKKALNMQRTRLHLLLPSIAAIRARFGNRQQSLSPTTLVMFCRILLAVLRKFAYLVLSANILTRRSLLAASTSPSKICKTRNKLFPVPALVKSSRNNPRTCCTFDSADCASPFA